LVTKCKRNGPAIFSSAEHDDELTGSLTANPFLLSFFKNLFKRQ